MKNEDVFRLIHNGIEKWKQLNPNRNIEQEFGMSQADILNNFYRIAALESSMDAQAIGDTHLPNWSYGLFQINKIHEQDLMGASGTLDELIQSGRELDQVVAAITVALDHNQNKSVSPFFPWTVYRLTDMNDKGTFKFLNKDGTSFESRKPTLEERITAIKDWNEAGESLDILDVPKGGIYGQYFGVDRTKTIEPEPEPEPKVTTQADINRTGLATSDIGPMEEQLPVETAVNIAQPSPDAPAPSETGSAGIASSGPTGEPTVFEGKVFGFDVNGDVSEILKRNETRSIQELLKAERDAREDVKALILSKSTNVNKKIFTLKKYGGYRDAYPALFSHAANLLNMTVNPGADGRYTIDFDRDMHLSNEWRTQASNYEIEYNLPAEDINILSSMGNIEQAYSFGTDGTFAVGSVRPAMGITPDYIEQNLDAIWKSYGAQITAGLAYVSPLANTNLYRITFLEEGKPPIVVNREAQELSPEAVAEATQRILWMNPNDMSDTYWGFASDEGARGKIPDSVLLPQLNRLEALRQNAITNDLEQAKLKSTQLYRAAQEARLANAQDNANTLTAYANEEAARANDLAALNELQKEQRQTLQNIFDALQSPADVLGATFALTGDESPMGTPLTMADKVNLFVNRYVQNAAAVQDRLDRTRTYEQMLSSLKPIETYVPQDFFSQPMQTMQPQQGFSPPAVAPTVPLEPVTAAPAPTPAAAPAASTTTSTDTTPSGLDRSTLMAIGSLDADPEFALTPDENLPVEPAVTMTPSWGEQAAKDIINRYKTAWEAEKDQVRAIRGGVADFIKELYSQGMSQIGMGNEFGGAVPTNRTGGVNLGNPIIVGDSNDGTENEELVMSLNGAPMVVLPLDENQQRIMARANRFIPRAQNGLPEEPPSFIPPGAFPDNPTDDQMTEVLFKMAEANALAAQGQAARDAFQAEQDKYYADQMANETLELTQGQYAWTDATDPTGEKRRRQQLRLRDAATPAFSAPATSGYSTADYTIGGQSRKPATTVSNATAGVNGSAGTSASDLFSIPGFSGNMTQQEIDARSDLITPPRARAVTSGGLRTSPEGGYRFRPDQQTRFGALGRNFAVPTPAYLSALTENERNFLRSNLATRNVFLADVEQDARRRFGLTGSRSGSRRFR